MNAIFLLLFVIMKTQADREHVITIFIPLKNDLLIIIFQFFMSFKIFYLKVLKIY